jgi:hypothetical protein
MILYNNALGDLFVSDKKIAEREAERQAEAAKLNTMAQIANQPASGGNKMLIILPIAILLIGGVIAIVIIKKKKGK